MGGSSHDGWKLTFLLLPCQLKTIFQKPKINIYLEKATDSRLSVDVPGAADNSLH